MPKISSQLQRNTIANFVGKGWTVLASFLFVPLYVKFLGVEAYGLIGFYAMLQGVLAFADMGLGAALTREMARLSAITGSEQASRNLLRTMEIIFWLIAVAIASLVAFLAPTIAHNWVNAQQLSPDTVAKVVGMMGIAIALVWPWSVYQGCLMGLQRQVASNGILVAMATLRGVGSVVILWRVSPTIEAFFVWQILVNTIQTALGGWFSWHGMPISGLRARYQNSVFRTIWRFAAGMMGITVMSTVLTQMDKAVVSKLLPLEALGYYTLAGLVAQIPALFSGPISYAAFPRLTQLVTLHDRASLSKSLSSRLSVRLRICFFSGVDIRGVLKGDHVGLDRKPCHCTADLHFGDAASRWLNLSGPASHALFSGFGAWVDATQSHFGACDDSNCDPFVGNLDTAVWGCWWGLDLDCDQWWDVAHIHAFHTCSFPSRRSDTLVRQ